MKKYYKMLLLILACIGSLMILSLIVDFPLWILSIFFTVGVLGLLIQRGMYKSLLDQFGFIERKLIKLKIRVPQFYYKIRDIGMELTFIFLLATISVNPVTDFIEGNININFSPNMLFIDLAIVSCFFANMPIIIYTFYSIITALDRQNI
ncbi:hypothetical protein [Solibacillus sp. CAU 1738]|uniref:hypothetical protein n=1 Tax=Solibacillus sp. CAU 1738 TaxID=3140363 RepID=UPI0032614940